MYICIYSCIHEYMHVHIYMNICMLDYFHYYYPDFVTAIWLESIFAVPYLNISHGLNATRNLLWNLYS